MGHKQLQSAQGRKKVQMLQNEAEKKKEESLAKVKLLQERYDDYEYCGSMYNCTRGNQWKPV
jgi:hypothetical protein